MTAEGFQISQAYGQERPGSSREQTFALVKRRLFNALGWIAIFLAGLELTAHLQTWLVEAQHPPAGRFVTVDGVRLHYLSKGAGRPVVFIHGNDGMLQDFTVCLMDLAAGKYRAIAFDRPGHGYSARPAQRLATVELQAQLIHDAASKLGAIKPAVVGHSWGGAVALSYALKYPQDVSALVLLAPVAYETAETSGHAQDYLEMVPVLGDLLIASFVVSSRPYVEVNCLEAFYPEKAPRDYADTYASLVLRSGQIKAYAEDEILLGRSLRAMSPHYGEIRVPTVIVTGTADSIVPPGFHAYRLHQAIPQSVLATIEGAGHQIELRRCEKIMHAIAIALGEERAN